MIICATLCIVYYNFNPEMYNFFPECPFHRFLQLDCPGCGSQRAVHSLLHGDVLLAANYNLLLVLSLPLLTTHFFLKVLGYAINRDFTLTVWQNPLTPKIIFVIVILFWIARNLPYEPFKYLAA